MAQSALNNGGRAVGLLRGAGTQMALWFYAMMHMLWQALRATVNQQKIVDLSLNETVTAAVHDIMDDKFWKCINIVLCAVYPALCLLCYCDKSTPAMDKIFFLSHQMTIALQKLEEFLNNESLFGDMTWNRNMSFEDSIVGGAIDSDNNNVVFQNPDLTLTSSDNEMDDDNSDANEGARPLSSMSFGRQFISHWEIRKQRIEHAYAIAGWALCVMEDVQKDVISRMTASHKMPLRVL
jgi:hypothetical protein